MSLKIKNFSVNIGSRQIIKNISLEIKQREIHALMGPNGSGKTTFAQALMGNKDYEAVGKNYEIKINNRSIKSLTTDKRARKGLFLSFQNPVAVPGVSVANLLRSACKFSGGAKPKSKKAKSYNPALSVWKLNELLAGEAKELKIKQELLSRSINEQFSGGEKKKLEMLQALILKPKYAVFDEIDTGVDIDALKVISRAIERLKQNGVGILLITHYARVLKLLRPDFVHILINGEIVESGSFRLAQKIEKIGYGKWRKT